MSLGPKGSGKIGKSLSCSIKGGLEKEATMSKKIILLALAAASVAAFALPATAMAVEEDVPLHAKEVPLNLAQTIDGVGAVTLRGTFGSITGTSWSGTATFTSSTTGTLQLTIKGLKAFGVPCKTPGQPAETIVTTPLEFHLLTVEDSFVAGSKGPGVLITSNVDPEGHPHFFTFECPPFGTFIVRGSGLIGTITKPACSGKSSEATIQFSPKAAGSNVQTHKTVVGTTTEYFLTTNGGESSLEAEGTITFKDSLGNKKEVTLECT
jgi:hypothetical protein